MKKSIIIGSINIYLAVLAALLLVVAQVVPVAAQTACPTLPTDKGVVTQSVNVPSTGTYKVWSRIMAPDTTNNSFYLEIDSTTCGVNVGDSSIAANSWTWVDYRDGNGSNKVSVNLSAGTHTFRFVGKEASVKLDRVLLLSDTCTPTGTGDNCTVTADTIKPTVSISSPVAGATVAGTINVAANANDDVGVTGVQFKLNGTNLGSEDTSSPYSVSWNTTTIANGAHTLTAVARDAAGNSTTSQAISVNVNNQTASGQADLVITNISWTPANPATGQEVTFNVTVKNQGTAAASEGAGVRFLVDGNFDTVTWVAHLSTTALAAGQNQTYTANGGAGGKTTWTALSGSHTVEAYVDDLGRIDESNNDNNTLTTTINVGTTSTADTQPPSAPSNLTASAAGTNQINLSWNASTDNVGVAGYRVYRNDMGSTPITTVAGTSYSNTGLSAGTAYSYTVVAFDTAGNNSQASNTATATTSTATPPPPPTATTGQLAGTVRSSNGQVIAYSSNQQLRSIRFQQLAGWELPG
jgi:chitodextrinase